MLQFFTPTKKYYIFDLIFELLIIEVRIETNCNQLNGYDIYQGWGVI